MKTKLPNQYSNLIEYNYNFKINSGLYFTIDLKLIKENCKNYMIKGTDAITIKSTDEFSILTIRLSRRERLQYLITKEINRLQLDKTPDKYLPESFKEYIFLSLETMKNFSELSQPNYKAGF